MPTGPKHQRFTVDEDNEDGEETSYYPEECRCMIGEDHEGDGTTSESLSVDDAALIWQSSGKDDDYTFGYSEFELRRAASRS